MAKENPFNELLSKQKTSPFPKSVAPMPATLVDNPFDLPGWIYEVKWERYRAMAFIKKGKVELSSRNAKSSNNKFYPIYFELQKWN